VKKPPLRLLLSAVTFASVFAVSRCGSDDPVVVQAEAVVAAIGAGIFSTQGTGTFNRANRDLPASEVTCPGFNSDTSVVDCVDKFSPFSSHVPGEYLTRSALFCQFSGPAKPAWWRTYFLIKFSSSVLCQNVKASPTGLIEANIAGLGLIGETVLVTHGHHLDQDNMRFPQNGEALFVYPLVSGWQEAVEGGTSVTFTSASERKILVKGIHAKAYRTLYGNTRDPRDIFSEYKAKSAGLVEASEEVLIKLWDRTFASQKVGDRLYQVSDAASDSTATVDSNIVVQWVSGKPVAKAGAILRTQDNLRKSFGLATLTTDLTYGDPTCCWPTEGQITTAFVPFMNLPSANGKAFTEELLEFSAGNACGVATVTQRGGDAGEGKASSVELFHCI